MTTAQNFSEEARLNEARLEALLKLGQMTNASLQQLTDFSLEQAVALTKSQIGYLAFMNDDETVLTMYSWSKIAMEECAIVNKPRVYPLESTGLWGEAARQRKPVVTNDYAAPSPMKKGLPLGHVPLSRHMNVPIVEDDHVVIVAGVGNKADDYDESDVRQLTLLMQGMWTIIQRHRVETELRMYRDYLEHLVEERTDDLRKEQEVLKHLLRSSDHERQIISYEIHDGLAQQLTGAILQFDAFRHLQTEKSDAADEAFERGMTILHQSHFEVRRLISGVRPPILDESGITAAIAHLVNEQNFEKGPTIEFQSKVSFDRLASVLENAIYRIIQEGVSNAKKHSKSKKVHISLLQQDERLQIEIRDWGVGFAPDQINSDRFGLEGIRQRARLLGGHALVESELKKGTSIKVELPLILKT